MNRNRQPQYAPLFTINVMTSSYAQKLCQIFLSNGDLKHALIVGGFGSNNIDTQTAFNSLF